MTDFIYRKSLKEIVTDLVTDGISIRAITRNSYIRQLILQNGNKLLANKHDVMKYVHDDYNEARSKMVEIIMGKF